MNPYAIFSTLWAHKLLTIPLVVLIAGVCGYALLYGPRVYESSATYVLITPDTPSEFAINNDPELVAKTDNPYLRSPEPSLAAQVVMTRLAASDVGESLEREGLSTDYVVSPANEFGSGQIIRITASADTPAKAVQTTSRIGTLMIDELRSIQLVNGADAAYLLTAQEVTPAGAAAERVSSRLRSVAMLGVAGVVVLFGAVSFARALEIRKQRKAPSDDASDDEVPPESSPDGAGRHDEQRDTWANKPGINGSSVLSRSK
jgi:hypothetical protein